MRILALFLPIFLLGDGHIFLYHRFGDSRHPYTNTPINQLIKNFEYLKLHNYKVIDSKLLLQKAKNGENVDKFVSIQIDDSFKSFYKNGFPIFKKYNYPFTLFVYVKGTTEKWGDFMSWKMIKEVSKYGDIQFHSYAHPHLTTLTIQQIKNDTEKGVQIFKKEMGYNPDSYAYPYGEYNLTVQKYLSKKFNYIYNQNEGGINVWTDFQDVPRIAMTGEVDISKKLKLSEMGVEDFQIELKNGIIKKISGNVPYKKLRIYITSLGWKWVTTQNGYFEYYPNFKLKKFRNRVILRYKNQLFIKMVTK